MKVLFFVPNTSAYPDRIKLLINISKRIEKFTLLIGSNDNNTCIDTCNLVELAFRRGRFINNRLIAGRSLFFLRTISMPIVEPRLAGFTTKGKPKGILSGTEGFSNGKKSGTGRL